MSETTLNALLADPSIWRAGAIQNQVIQTRSTGIPALDRVLPGNGWPSGALSEILLPADGVGELRLVLPALARLTQEGRDVMVVGPPYTPYLAGWARKGVVMRHVEFVSPTPDHAPWAIEQCLQSGAYAAVLGWPRRIGPPDMRRLQLAAAVGGTLGFVFRDRRLVAQPSPAALRLEVETRPCRIRVHKCRGGREPSQLIAL